MKNKKYLHCSLDCWETVIKANPLHKSARDFLLHSVVFPEIEISEEEFSKEVRKTKLFCDFCNESLGTQIDWKQSLLMVGRNYSGFLDKSVMLRRLRVFDAKYIDVLREFSPTIYSEDTLRVLEILEEKHIGMNISCNSSFIRGFQLDQILQNIGVLKYFNFTLYSDVIGFSKPSPKFFREVINKAGVVEGSILHVGDNLFSDGGCRDLDIDFLHVNGSSGNLITDVLNYV